MHLRLIESETSIQEFYDTGLDVIEYRRRCKCIIASMVFLCFFVFILVAKRHSPQYPLSPSPPSPSYLLHDGALRHIFECPEFGFDFFLCIVLLV